MEPSEPPLHPPLHTDVSTRYSKRCMPTHAPSTVDFQYACMNSSITNTCHPVLEVGWVTRMIQVTWVTFCPSRFMKYLGLTWIKSHDCTICTNLELSSVVPREPHPLFEKKKAFSYAGPSPLIGHTCL